MRSGSAIGHRQPWLVYPWSKGLKIDDILAYYEEEKFRDWVHADTGAPVLKAQHPEFELWNQAFTRVRAWPAPTVTCLTSGKAASKSATIMSARLF